MTWSGDLKRRVFRSGIGLALIAWSISTHPARVTAACVAPVLTPGITTYEALEPTTSADGRYTAFYTQAPLLGSDTNNQIDVYVFDRISCGLEVVSVATDGTQGNNPSTYASISGDGQTVAFMSTASNLVANDTNVGVDVFVRNRTTHTTIRASVKSNGDQTVAGSQRPHISADGTAVAFASDANDLVTGDTNNLTDVFVRDLVANTTSRVSVATGGTQGLNGGAELGRPAISADGRYVAFSAAFTNLVASDTNNASDIFRHDRQTGTTIRVSVVTGGAQSQDSRSSFKPAISADGRYVVFDYDGSNFGAATGGTRHVYRHDVDTVTTVLVSTATSLQPLGADRATISSDGRYVAFAGAGSTFVPGDGNSQLDVFVKDMTTGHIRRASTSASGTEGNLASPSWGTPEISGDGRVVVFDSLASTFVGSDTNTQDDVFIVEWPLLSATPNVNLMRNGTFASSLTNWLTFATPDASYLVANTTGSVLQFYRNAPPAGTTNQAVVFQETGQQLAGFAPVTLTLDIGNSDTVRKRISVLLHDGDFSDLHVCTFWLPASSSLQTYTIRTHTTRPWANATVSLYAASTNAAGNTTGFYRVDNLDLRYDTGGLTSATTCQDPTVPAPPGGNSTGNLIVNGAFTGTLVPWTTFGQIQSQLNNGVFEFIKLAGSPSGVVLQPTGAGFPANQIFTSTFQLGNSSGVRKRVTVIVHDNDFSDLAACTFWLPPGQPLSLYRLRAFTTKVWSNATVSVYPATTGADQWIQLDNVTLVGTPPVAIVGTECAENLPADQFAPRGPERTVAMPAGSSGAAANPETTSSADDPDGLTLATMTLGSTEVVVLSDTSVGPRVAEIGDSIDLTAATEARLTFDSWLSSDARATVEVSADDGVTWDAVRVVRTSDGWVSVDVDLSAYSGERVRLRFALSAASETTVPGIWQVSQVRIKGH